MSGPVLLTMGEPAGIGGEITLMAWRAAKARNLPTFAVIDDAARLKACAAALGLDTPVQIITRLSEASAAFRIGLPVLHRPLKALPVAGRPDPRNAQAVIAAIDEATDFCLSGEAAAMVTNPIHKASLYAAGFSSPGHTEYLALHIAKRRGGGAATPVMLLAIPGLRVVPVSIHLSLAEAIKSLTTEAIIETGVILAEALKHDFGCPSPRIAVAALNPHAGESGTLGQEEARIIAPACAALRAQGLAIEGPLPADTLFHEAARTRFDAVLCMYHDQALIPLKTLDFARGVNVTLGLPIIRTSPDHGTAFDIAGTGKADPASLIEAILLADMLARNRTGAGGAQQKPGRSAPGARRRRRQTKSWAFRAQGRPVSETLGPPLREVIAAHGLDAKKGLGQHFLLDLNLTRRIARAAAPLDDATIIEIGPGPGGLTRALLLEGAKHVIAVERDRRCIAALQELAALAPGRLTIIEADALTVDERALAPEGPVKIVANLPYNISTALLVKWLTADPWPPWYESLTLMFQKEVAERLIAEPRTKAYGRLSLLTQWRTEARRLFDIDPRAFVPPPQVTSTVVSLAPRAQPEAAPPLLFEKVVAAAFNQRRKMLRASLSRLGLTDAMIAEAGIAPTARAEELDVAGFARLARLLALTVR